MNAGVLQDALVRVTAENSGHEEHRRYLGMSQIAKCPRRLFFEVQKGTPADIDDKLRCYKGYQMERDLLARLGLALDLLGGDWVLTPEVGEISALGEQFIGHPDGELVFLDGEEKVLVEIKSTLQESLDRIIVKARIPTRHWWQVQCYLRFGGWERALVIYEARDTGRLYVHPVRRHKQTGERCERKARIVLDALEVGTPPRCACGRCRY